MEKEGVCMCACVHVCVSILLLLFIHKLVVIAVFDLARQVDNLMQEEDENPETSQAGPHNPDDHGRNDQQQT